MSQEKKNSRTLRIGQNKDELDHRLAGLDRLNGWTCGRKNEQSKQSFMWRLLWQKLSLLSTWACLFYEMNTDYYPLRNPQSYPWCDTEKSPVCLEFDMWHAHLTPSFPQPRCPSLRNLWPKTSSSEEVNHNRKKIPLKPSVWSLIIQCQERKRRAFLCILHAIKQV